MRGISRTDRLGDLGPVPGTYSESTERTPGVLTSGFVLAPWSIVKYFGFGNDCWYSE